MAREAQQELPWPRYVRVVLVGERKDKPVIIDQGTMTQPGKLPTATYVRGSRVAELTRSLTALVDLVERKELRGITRKPSDQRQRLDALADAKAVLAAEANGEGR